jgi:thiamine-phosphate pyrophosphorylase
MISPRVVLITDAAYDDERITRVVSIVASALAHGTLVVQLRDKVRARPLVKNLGERIVEITRANRAIFVVNRDVDLARDLDADGVHLGRDACSIEEARAMFGKHDAWISIAAHDDDDVRRAVRDGADAVLVSPIFATTSGSPSGEEKSGRGVSALTHARSIADGISIFALGGINEARAPFCIAAGAGGIAAIGSFFRADDPADVARAFARAAAGIARPVC